MPVVLHKQSVLHVEDLQMQSFRLGVLALLLIQYRQFVQGTGVYSAFIRKIGEGGVYGTTELFLRVVIPSLCAIDPCPRRLYSKS